MNDEVEKLQRRLERALSRTFGKRCKTEDICDFAELNGDDKSRCVTCLAYEELDKFVVSLVKRLAR